MGYQEDASHRQDEGQHQCVEGPASTLGAGRQGSQARRFAPEEGVWCLKWTGNDVVGCGVDIT